MNHPAAPWHQADFVALDLEGSGAQDREREAILEIALVPLRDGRPIVGEAFATLVNPGRPIPRRPWISPGLTDEALRSAPTIARAELDLASRINGRYLVGHNIGVDWRLLHRHCRAIEPAGLIDTLRLARALRFGTSNSLTALVNDLDLAAQVNAAAPNTQPHRALWDTVAAAHVLVALVGRIWAKPPTLSDLVHAATSDTSATDQRGTRGDDRQGTLF